MNTPSRSLARVAPIALSAALLAGCGGSVSPTGVPATTDLQARGGAADQGYIVTLKRGHKPADVANGRPQPRVRLQRGAERLRRADPGRPAGGAAA